MNNPRPISELTDAHGEVLAYFPDAKMFYIVYRDPFDDEVRMRNYHRLTGCVTHWWRLPDTEGIE